MEFKRIHDVQTIDGYNVPAFLFASPSAKGGAVVCHGYGGCKEEMLGLAACIAEMGYAALCLDLRGYGQNTAPIGAGVLDDLENDQCPMTKSQLVIGSGSCGKQAKGGAV